MQKLIDKKMLDYVALDIKAPLNEKYSLNLMEVESF